MEGKGRLGMKRLRDAAHNSCLSLAHEEKFDKKQRGSGYI
jgi:hypothetical protein